MLSSRVISEPIQPATQSTQSHGVYSQDKKLSNLQSSKRHLSSLGKRKHLIFGQNGQGCIRGDQSLGNYWKG
jgi:hypothetical protein